MRHDLEKVRFKARDKIDWELLEKSSDEGVSPELWKEELRKALGLAGFSLAEASAIVEREGDDWLEIGFDYCLLFNAYTRIKPSFYQLAEAGMLSNVVEVWDLIVDAWGDIEAAAREGGVPITPGLIERAGLDSFVNFVEKHGYEDYLYAMAFGEGSRRYYLLVAERG
jgi:hypothetical protein